MADQGMVLAYTEEQGPESGPYLVPIHAAPIFSSEPIDPIPQWLHQLLIGQSAIFHMLVNAAKKLDDWGVAADITRYWSTTTRWLTSTCISSSSRPKQTQCDLLGCSAKGGSKQLGCPSSWCTWSALCRSSYAARGAMTGLRSPSKGVGSVKHKVVLS